LTGAFLALAAVAAACSSGGEGPGDPASLSTPSIPYRVTTPFLVPLPTGYRLETVLDGLDQPTAIAATPEGRLLITEQVTGRVRVVRDGVLLDEPWAEIPVYHTEAFLQELGLVGIAVDPEFETNRFVYLYYTERDAAGARRTVLARLRDVDGRGTDLTPIFTVELAPERSHIAGGIAFDRDGALLLTVGDHERGDLAPRLDVPVGKVLRMDRDGAPMPDNPFAGREDADPRVYAYGLRNPFGVAVDRETGEIFITENRDAAGDAVYRVEPGADYGWPGEKVVSREPLVLYERPMGVAGATVYRGDALPEFDGDLFYCTFHEGGALHWSDTGPLEGVELAKRDRLIAPGCSTGVTQGADGFLYFLAYTGQLMRISR
jgi:glucose/arabinose dehydrogenase